MNENKKKFRKFKGFNKSTRIIIQITIFIVVILVIGSSVLLKNYANPHTDVHKILKIDKIKSVQGDSDGFTTDVYYMVSTNKGAYKIKVHGLNACLECSGIKEGETYILKTRGMSFPLIGWYPNIVGYENNN